LSASQYTIRFASVAVVGGALAFGAWRVRRRLLPHWWGAPARLVEAILALALVNLVLQLTGAVGLFRRGPAFVALVLAGLLAGSLARARPGRRPAVAAPPTAGLPSGLVAAGVGALLAGEWTPRVVEAFRSGMYDPDSLTYHLPFAARFAQIGWVTRLHFIAPDGPTTFQVGNSELVHGLGILLVGRDTLSPLFNVGWLALLLLAAWCIGRPRGLGPVTLTATALVMSTSLLSTTQPGSAMTDTSSAFFLLAAIAVLLHARWETPAVAVAALAAGMAVSTKLTTLAPVLVLSVGLVVAAPAVRRRAVTAAWLVPLVGAGSFWFLRNWARVGSPVPTLHLPLLPHPHIKLVEKYGFSVAHYATDVHVWRTNFLPGLKQAFGYGWFLVVGLAVAASVLAAAGRHRPSVERVVGLAGVAAAVGYIFTPTTAFGLAGRPILFVANLRYLTPALVIGLALLPLVPALGRRRVRWSLLGGLLALLLVTQLRAGGDPPWLAGHHPAAAAAAVGVLVVVALTAVAGRRQVSPRAMTGAVVVVALGAAAIGWAVQRDYLRSRYADGSRVQGAAYAWARTVGDQRIGFAGFFQQYPLYGTDLSNRVQYVGRRGPHGAFTELPSCPSWMRALDAGGYRYVVVAPAFQGDTQEPVQAGWTRHDPAAHEVLHSGLTSVFRLDGPADPNACPP